MAGLNNGFHVEFGFNETDLTSLLETGLYHDAEKIILQNAHGSYLDEGCYERTPLNIVLSGVTNTNRKYTRNLYMAKCLVQHGASPNYRVPKTDVGYYLGPGETPLELLVHFYNEITSHEACIEIIEPPMHHSEKQKKWNRKESPVIGMKKKFIEDLEELKEDILELVFIMLSHGGDCNVLNKSRQTLLHRTAAYSSDARMLEVLCENGADMNAVDIHGNSALMLVCRYCQEAAYHLGESYSQMYDQEGYLGKRKPLENCCDVIKSDFIRALLRFEGTEVNIRNKNNKTALFYCMERGDWTNACLLLQNGCSVSDMGVINTSYLYRAVSPLFISLNSSHTANYIKKTFTEEPGCQVLSQIFPIPLVDPGNFDQNKVLEELYNDVEANLRNIHLPRIKQLGTEVIHLLFGHSTCTLRQLCARKIFQTFMKNFCHEALKIGHHKKDASNCSQGMDGSSLLRDCTNRPDYESRAAQTVSVGILEEDGGVVLSSYQLIGENSGAQLVENNSEEGAYGDNIGESNGTEMESHKLNVIVEVDEKEYESELSTCGIEQKIPLTEQDKKKTVSDDMKPEVNVHDSDVSDIGPKTGNEMLNAQHECFSVDDSNEMVNTGSSKESSSIDDDAVKDSPQSNVLCEVDSGENTEQKEVTCGTSECNGNQDLSHEIAAGESKNFDSGSKVDDSSVVTNTEEDQRSFIASGANTTQEDSTTKQSEENEASVDWQLTILDLWDHLRGTTLTDLDPGVLSHLNLPRDVLICFEVELLRLSLLLCRATEYYFIYKQQQVDRLFDRGPEEMSSEGSVSEDDESDDEYW